MPSRTAKRKRASVDDPAVLDEIAHAQNEHQLFTAWAKLRGVEINGVEAKSIPGRGVGLVTTKTLKEGDRIIFIPEKAMFQPDATLLKRNHLTAASPQAQLAVSALCAFEKLDSSFFTWQEVLPDENDFKASMPMYWPRELHEFLPPAVKQPLTRQITDYEKDWKAVKELCKRRNFPEERFKYFWMIVNSRSFHWKPPQNKAGIMVMCPFIDYLNHGPTGSGCNVLQNAKGYEVLADRSYEVGEEILATYGAHSNDKLLVHYGFMNVSPTTGSTGADDEIRLDAILLHNLTDAIKDQLQDVGFLGGYSLSPETGEICFKTEVAIRATLLTANEWEYFVSSGEDLSEDRTKEVRGLVKKWLREYRPHVMGLIESVEGEGEQCWGQARELIKARWRQIGDAIDKFEV